MFDYLQGFRLICINEGFEWSLDNFLKCIIKALDEGGTCVANSTGSDVVRAKKLLAFYLLLQGNITAHLCPHNSIETALAIMTSYETILESNGTSACIGDYLIECVSAENLLLLVPFDPVRCLSSVKQWLEKQRFSNQGFNLPESLVGKAKCTYSIYKNKLPDLIVI